MKKDRTTDAAEEKSAEVKMRMAVWLYPSTWDAIDRAAKADNCKSRSEYLEKAALFYAGYISGQDATAYLPPALVSAMRGTIQNTEQHICRLLFKLAVELNMMMNLIAAEHAIDVSDLERMRGRCVREVKKTGGSISFKDAVEYQQDDA